MSTLVTADNISLSFGDKKILKDVSFSIDAGEYVGLIWPNGAGKTSLIKVILGLFKTDSWSYHISPDQTIGYVPQTFSLSHVVPVSVQEVLCMTRKQKKVQLISALQKVSLEADFLDKNFHTLSGWQKQRVIIARALCLNPTILIFDEPLNGVDYKTKCKIYKLLEKLNQEEWLTIIFVSHEVDQIIDVCNRVLCLDTTLHTGCHPLDFAKWNTNSCPVLKKGSHVVPIHHHHNTKDSCQC